MNEEITSINESPSTDTDIQSTDEKSLVMQDSSENEIVKPNNNGASNDEKNSSSSISDEVSTDVKPTVNKRKIRDIARKPKIFKPKNQDIDKSKLKEPPMPFSGIYYG